MRIKLFFVTILVVCNLAWFLVYRAMNKALTYEAARLDQVERQRDDYLDLTVRLFPCGK